MQTASNAPPVDRCPPELPRGVDWVLSRLRDAALPYAADDRVIAAPWAEGSLWVTAPFGSDSPEIEAAFRQMRALWQVGDIVIYGRSSSNGDQTLLYWRAGDVDHHLSSGLSLPRIEQHGREPIDRLASSAAAHPYR
jgi:hypothetical protein